MLCKWLSLALIALSMSAQTVTGTLEGRVTDPAGAVVPAAQIKIKEINTGTVRSSESNTEGFFQIPYLALGTYEVSIEAPGFQPQTSRATIELNRTTVLNVNIAVAGTQQAITISDAAPVVDVTSGQIRRSVSEDLIDTIPISGRDFRQLFRIIPGFQSNPTAGQDNFTLSSGSSASFNGTGTRSAIFQTDGIANDDNSENQNRQVGEYQHYKRVSSADQQLHCRVRTRGGRDRTGSDKERHKRFSWRSLLAAHKLGVECPHLFSERCWKQNRSCDG